MKLPEKFQFKHFKSDDLYTATKSGEEYLVTWKHGTEGSVRYVTSSAYDNVANKYWIIQQTNGVDAEGNPLNFTVEDLKPFMRAQTRCGRLYVVCPGTGEDAFHLVRETGHNRAYFDAAAVDGYTDSEITAVYAQPAYWDMLDPCTSGPLLWKATPKEENKEQDKNPFKERLEYFETSLKAISEEFAVFKAEAS